MKLINFLIAINFLVLGGGNAWGNKTSDRIVYLKNRIEQLENQAGTLKEIQVLQKELDDLEHIPKMPKIDPNLDAPFIDGSQKDQSNKENYTSNPGSVDFFHERTNLVAVDYGVPKEVVEEMKGRIHSSEGIKGEGAKITPPSYNEVPSNVIETSKEEIRKRREDIHASRGVIGKRLKIPKKSVVPKPQDYSKKAVRQQPPAAPQKVMHGRPSSSKEELRTHETPRNEAPRLESILPVDAPITVKKTDQQSGWGFCGKDIPYLQEQLEIKIAQLSKAQEAIKRTKDGFEVQKLANQIQQLENDKQYYIKMIQSLGGTPKIQKTHKDIAKTVVPVQSQEFQIKSDLERLEQAEKAVRHRVRITKDPRALSALGASLENIQQQKKLLKASAKDKGAMDETELYETPSVFTQEKTKKTQEGTVSSMASSSTDQSLSKGMQKTQPAIPQQLGQNSHPTDNWSKIAQQAVNPDIEEYIDDDEVIKSAPQKPLWADVPERSSQQQTQQTRTQKRGRSLSQSEAQSIARVWLNPK
jgi:hypothetical protein